MLPSIREISLFRLAVCAAAFASACADSQTNVLDSSTATARGEDASSEEDPSPGEDPDLDEEDPEDTLDASEQASEDAGPSEEEGLDAEAETDAGEQELDGAAPEGDAAETDAEAPDAQAPDADAPDAGDAGLQNDASTPDAAACPVGQTPDACGVCGGDGASCRHPLTGRYAARTQFYARQQATIDSTTLDLVSKGSVLSVVDISAAGVATEHYCFLEIVSPDGLFVWSTPATVQQIPDTSVTLEERAGRFVRPLASHRAYFGWSPEAAPADCVAGQTHASGCLCGAPDALPTDADDCRVRDIDSDGVPGGSMYLDLTQPADPSAVSTQLKLNVMALLNLEWSLAAPAAGQIVGDIEGGLDQAVLSLEGELAAAVSAVDNSMCDSALGHVELVSGDFDCSAILAGRTTNAVTYGIFDADLDPAVPSLEICESAAGN